MSREFLESAIAVRDGEIASLREDLRRYRADLVDAYQQRQVNPNLMAANALVNAPRKERDAVIDAIMQKSAGNGEIRSHLISYAMNARRQQVPDDEIVQAIYRGRSSDDEGVPS